MAFLAHAAFGFPPLWRRQKRGELATAAVIWLAALIYSGLLPLHLMQ